MQPIAAVLLVKLPNGKVIASAVFLWGSALCLMSACTNFASLLGLRFVLVSKDHPGPISFWEYGRNNYYT